MRLGSACAALAFALAASASPACAATLVSGGKDRAKIVVADKATAIALYAAEEFQQHVELATGARLPIVRESQVKDRSGALVLVGPSKGTRALGLDPDTLPAEGYIVRATRDRLALLGRDEGALIGKRRVTSPLDPMTRPGTLWAVYAFLDREMGVRWLWPGESGRVVPRRRSLRVGDTLYVSAPRLAQRRIRCLVTDRRAMKSLFDRQGVNRAAQKRMEGEWRRWSRRQMLGASRRIYTRPAFGDWYARYFAKHAEWFAERPEGKRYARGHQGRIEAKLCVSNAAAINAVYEQGLRFLRSRPRALCFSATPNPGGGYCVCPKCKAMDDPRGQVWTYAFRLDDGREIAVPWVTMSTRYAKVWNYLAGRLAKDAPDRYVGVRAIGPCAEPPRRLALRPNVIVSLQGFNYVGHFDSPARRRTWDAWERTGCRPALRSSFLDKGHGFPFIYARRMGRDIKFCARRGLIGVDLETWRGHHASQGLNVYALARLLADPSRGVEAVIDEFCSAGFGKAAPAIKEYFKRCEAVTDRLAETGFPASRSEAYAVYGKLFDARFAQGARVLFFRARQMESDPAVRRRIDFLETGLDYAELGGRALLKTYEMAVKGADPPGALEAIARKEAFMRSHKASWAVHVASLRWDEWDPSKTDYFGLNVLRDLKGKNVFAALTDWRFCLDPEKVGTKEGWWQADHDDRDWSPIKAGKWWESQGFGGGANRTDIEGGYNGVAWYRTTALVPLKLKGRKIILRFGAIDESGWVYVNGKPAAQSVFDPKKNPDAWVTPVEADITKLVKFGAENSISVKVRDDYGAGGLWRLVSLHWESP